MVGVVNKQRSVETQVGMEEFGGQQKYLKYKKKAKDLKSELKCSNTLIIHYKNKVQKYREKNTTLNQSMESSMYKLDRTFVRKQQKKQELEELQVQLREVQKKYD